MTVYNFSAGPAVLPNEVLRQAAAEMTDWHGSGMSVMEMSHRGEEFMSIHAAALRDFRELLRFRKITRYCSCKAAASAKMQSCR
jgi:phosphoserine aminotransferase